jgi:hypothetical protein
VDELATGAGKGKRFANGEPASARPRLRLLKWRPAVKGVLRGFADLEFWFGLRIVDCPVLISNGRAWVSLPVKPQIVDGRQRLNEAGKPAFLPVLGWRNRTLQDRFSEAVIALLLEQHPDALDP